MATRAIAQPSSAQPSSAQPSAPPSAPAVARQALSQVQLTGADRTQALVQASAALNRISAVRGRFSQIAPDGSASQGDIYLQRPGKMRFAYDAPSPLTIVSDGATVSVHDSSVRDVSRVPLRSTPLYYVLKRDVSLERDARIVRVARSGGDSRASVCHSTLASRRFPCRCKS